MNQLEQESVARERRSQQRIEIQIPVKVILPGVETPALALNQNVSWGGMLFIIAESLPKQSGVIRVILPWKRGEHISAEAQLLRARPLEDGRYMVAIRFVSLSPRSNSRLEKLLKLLKTGHSSVPSEEAGGLFRELEVAVNDADELRAMLAQIATGLHKVTVFDSYQSGQSISFAIAGTRDLPGIKLRARVIDVEQSRGTGFQWANLYTLTMKFEHPPKAIKAYVKFILGHLPPPSSRLGGYLPDGPDWLRASSAHASASAAKQLVSSKRGMPSVLEARFPEALNHVIAGWGDVEAFEILFRELVLDDRHGQPGGWPKDAWEELELLQIVHDCAYGVSRSRRDPLKGGRIV